MPDNGHCMAKSYQQCTFSDMCNSRSFDIRKKQVIVNILMQKVSTSP